MFSLFVDTKLSMPPVMISWQFESSRLSSAEAVAGGTGFRLTLACNVTATTVTAYQVTSYDSSRSTEEGPPGAQVNCSNQRVRLGTALQPLPSAAIMLD
jgi:hypothetical protein